MIWHPYGIGLVIRVYRLSRPPGRFAQATYGGARFCVRSRPTTGCWVSARWHKYDRALGKTVRIRAAAVDTRRQAAVQPGEHAWMDFETWGEEHPVMLQ